jgi:hypothetical protein
MGGRKMNGKTLLLDLHQLRLVPQRETGVGRSNFKFGVFSFPDASIDSPAKFEICTPDPNVATLLLLAAQQVQVM